MIARRTALISLVAFALGAAVLPVALPGAENAKSLERRARRFYTYYYLNHYDDMWEVFHDSLREKLGGDKKAYVRSLRASELELHDAVIEDVEVRDGRGRVEVSLVFFYRDVGKPIPRRHRMYWVWDSDRWWYMGSELLDSGEPLSGETADPSLGEPVAAREKAVPRETVVSGQEGEPRQPRPERQVAEAPSVAMAEPEPEGGDEAHLTESEEKPLSRPEIEKPVSGASRAKGSSDIRPTGLPEDLDSKSESPSEAGETRWGGDELAQRLINIGMIRRQNRLDAIASRLGPEDLQSLQLAMKEADFPVREWCVEQVGRLAQRHERIRDASLEALIEIIQDSSDNGLKAAAAGALERLGSPEAREPLEDLLLEGHDRQQIAAARGLAVLQDPRSTPFLYATWKRSRDPVVRMTCLTALSSIRDPEASEYLASVARSGEPPMEERMQALRGLALSSTQADLDHIHGLFEVFGAGEYGKVHWRQQILLVAALYRLEAPDALDRFESLVDVSPKKDASPGSRLFGRFIAEKGDLALASRLLGSDRAAIRFPGAIAVSLMAVEGSEAAAEILRGARPGEQDADVAAALDRGLRLMKLR